MKPPQIFPDQTACPADPVMVGIVVEIGVEARDDFESIPHRIPQDAQAEGRLGGDMDQVGSEGMNGPMDRAERRQREVEFLIEREHDRSHGMRRSIDLGRPAVVGMNQLDRVALSPQVPDQFTQGPRDAVDLGEIGFRDDCDAHDLPSKRTAPPTGLVLLPGRRPAAWELDRRRGRPVDNDTANDATQPGSFVLDKLSRSRSVGLRIGLVEPVATCETRVSRRLIFPKTSTKPDDDEELS